MGLDEMMNRKSLVERCQSWATAAKRDLIALWLACRDQRVPWHAKAVAALVVAYALSPIDLIPDFVPILGYLDDLILVPLGIVIAMRLIPAVILEELRRAAADSRPPRSTAGAVIVITIWLAVIALCTWLWLPDKQDFQLMLPWQGD